jgi:hypothetical protein
LRAQLVHFWWTLHFSADAQSILMCRLIGASFELAQMTAIRKIAALRTLEDCAGSACAARVQSLLGQMR